MNIQHSFAFRIRQTAFKFTNFSVVLLGGAAQLLAQTQVRVPPQSIQPEEDYTWWYVMLFVLGLGLAAGWVVRVSFVVLVFKFFPVFSFRCLCVFFSFVIFSVCVVCLGDLGLADRFTDLLVQDLNRVFWLWGFGLIFCWFGLKGYASMPISVFESEIVLSMVKCMTPILISG